MKLLLIGNGAWGQNYVKEIKANFKDVNLTIATRENWKDLIDQEPDGVIIATPPDSHLEIALYVLEKNIPVLLEKPAVLSSFEIEKLRPYQENLVVNYIHLHNDKYKNIKSLIYNENITHITTNGQGPCNRVNYSGLWDYGPHDLSMILDLSNKIPYQVECRKLKDHSSYDLFIINLTFDTFKSTSMVGFNVSKSRNIDIETDNMSVYYSDVGVDHKMTPLNNAIYYFMSFIDHYYCDYEKLNLLYGFELSVNVTKILEACEESLAKQSIINIR
jgi:predicted dehydrogenase